MYTKLGDGLWGHPKVIEAGNEAVGIFCRMLSYCGRYSDGEVSEETANILSAGNLSALEKLTEVGLIKKQKRGWLIPSYLEHNISQAEWREKKDKDAERKRRERAAASNGKHPTSASDLEDLLDAEPAE